MSSRSPTGSPGGCQRKSPSRERAMKNMTSGIYSIASRTCLGRLYSALDVRAAADVAAALVDDYSPTAIEDRDQSIRIFFTTDDSRTSAGHALTRAGYQITAVDVDDEDWARRSQDNLEPVTVGRITVLPNPNSQTRNPDALSIVIEPSMAFGTGHHV